MLGRKDYTQDEIARARAVVDQQLATYDVLAAATAKDAKAAAALAAFEPGCFNQLLVALDRPFVHRVRPFTGKDTNPLSEVELLVTSLLDHGGVLTTDKVVKWVPEQSITGLEPGDPIHLTRDGFAALAGAFLAEVATRSGL